MEEKDLELLSERVIFNRKTPADGNLFEEIFQRYDKKINEIIKANNQKDDEIKKLKQTIKVMKAFSLIGIFIKIVGFIYRFIESLFPKEKGSEELTSEEVIHA